MATLHRDHLPNTNYKIIQFLWFLACPSAPRELNVLEVLKSTVQLAWEPPEDDGGSPITGYIIEKREVSRKTWGKVSSFFLIWISMLFSHVLLSFLSYFCNHSLEINFKNTLKPFFSLGCWSYCWPRIHCTWPHPRERIFI